MKSLKEFINEQLENSNQNPIKEEQALEATQTNIQEGTQPNSEEPTEEK